MRVTPGAFRAFSRGEALAQSRTVFCLSSAKQAAFETEFFNRIGRQRPAVGVVSR